MNQLTTALIVDDEPNGAENLQTILLEFCPQIRVLKISTTLNEAEEDILLLNPTIVFLDIQIGTRLVFEMLEALPEINFEIIFVSAYDHALDAFKFMAIDYLLKPIDIKSLKKAVNQAIFNSERKLFAAHYKEFIAVRHNYDPDKQKIAIPTSDGYEMVPVKEIMYCIAEGSYTAVHVDNNIKFLASKHLKFYEELLRDFHFMRIHHSYLINKNFIKKVSKSDGGYLVMQDNTTFSISKSRRELTFTELNLG